MALVNSPYGEFSRIIVKSYSEEEIRALNHWANEEMQELDYEASEKFEKNEKKIFDQEYEDWDFREPPDIFRNEGLI